VYKYVSIIVPVYNGALTIEECIKSLLNLEYPEAKYEIIIVDNKSLITIPLILR
jgi:glycosyltransferase involved in cell wall biosynthesis